MTVDDLALLGLAAFVLLLVLGMLRLALAMAEYLDSNRGGNGRGGRPGAS